MLKGRSSRRRDFILFAGAAIALPGAARAQQPRAPLIGFLGAGSAEPNGPDAAGFREGLAEAGYVDGRNVTIEFRWANNQSRVLPGLAASLVRLGPSVIVASRGISAAVAAKSATSTIPIVFANGGDPVKYGLVASLNQPGGNLTGFTFLTQELAGKRLSLLRNLVPQATILGYLSGDPRTLTYDDQKTDILAASRALGFQVVVVEARSDLDFEAAFATFVERGAQALVLGAFPFLFDVPRNREKIVELAARHKIPAIYPNRSDAVAGGLMSYSADVAGIHRQIGVQYVGQILKGAKPADLPVQQPTKFELVLNLKAAKALNLEITGLLQVQVDEVIE